MDHERRERTPEDVEAIDDPAERARAATELLGSYQRHVTHLARVRRQAVTQLRSQGLSYGQVADALGLSRGRIAQLGADRYLPEQEFFGGERVTITTPLRRQGTGRPVIAQEDFEAAMTLSRFLNSVEIETSFDQVKPTGEVDFKATGLIAICGPKSSQQMRQLIDTDPTLAYAPDQQGRWRIVDRTDGQEFRSPLDQEEPEDADVAYLARLTIPDRSRTVIVIAGVHAIGSFGVATYLADAERLRQLHRVVGTKPFSAVVRSTFVREPLAITDTHLLLQPRLH